MMPQPGWRRAWVRIVPTVATAVAVTLFVLAGNWQRERLAQKDAQREQLLAAFAMPPASFPPEVASWPAWRYRTVELRGRYDAARQILLDNRVHAGRAGYHVVTPLHLGDGRSVLVNRGFIAGGPTREVLPPAPPPDGDVAVRGRINLPPRFLTLGEPPPKRVVWQNLDFERYARETGIAVLPIVIEELDGLADGLVRDWPRPEVAGDRHLVYMVQWYGFAALALGLWAWFTFRKRR